MVFKGNIELSDTIMVSDPCYGLNTWCQKTLTGVKSGTYKCYVSYFYDSCWCPTYRRVRSITVKHIDYKTSPNHIVHDCCIGIDAGCCGIYDLEYYKKYHKDTNESEQVDETWYDNICDNIFIKEKVADYIPVQKTDEYMNIMNKISDIYNSGNIDNKKISKLHLELLHLETRYTATHPRYKEMQDAYCRDNKCFISASAYGDGNAKLYAGKNESGEIVSLKLTFC